MIKRMNKVTALLIAAASMISIVPAMAADSTTSKLATKDGTIENAIAYQGGKYIYQGYTSDNATDGLYYNGGDTDKALSDLSSADLNTTYADKYAFANNGSDQYLVDLTSGDESDSTTPSDDIDTAATKLQTKLKKTSRYGTTLTGLTAQDNLGYSGANNAVGTLPGNKFGDNWYSYKVATDSSDSDHYVANGRNLYGFTDGSGNYVDASYLGNIYAYSTKEGRTVEINNYSNSYDDVDSDSGLLATLAGQPVVLTQDKDYIYALVNVAITDTASNAVDTNGSTTSTAAYVTNGTATASATTTIRTYVQKISKAQGDQKDDAYLPKTVESYEVGNANGTEYDCSDAENAYSAIKTALGVNPIDATQADAVATSSSNDGLVKAKFAAVNGNLVAIDANSSNIDATTLFFKQDKVKFDTAPGYKSSTTGLTPSTKVDAYLMEKDSDDSVDLNSSTNLDPVESYDIDVDGNVWMVTDGKIYEYQNAKFNEVYTCDSGLDAISIYDANSLIAWENSGNIYTTVNQGNFTTATDAGTAATTDAGTAATTESTTGWVQATDRTWTYNKADGTKATGWLNDNGTWYMMKADGTMTTGWYNDNGNWYFLNTSGAMKTGWILDGSTWYYLNGSGSMKTGWLNDNGTWYYLNASGAMAANTTVDGYVLNASGAWIK